jgi:hypothetical protein
VANNEGPRSKSWSQPPSEDGVLSAELKEERIVERCARIFVHWEPAAIECGKGGERFVTPSPHLQVTGGLAPSDYEKEGALSNDFQAQLAVNDQSDSAVVNIFGENIPAGKWTLKNPS